MDSRTLPLLELHGDDPLAWGHQHGETMREKIKEIAEIRMERMCEMSAFKKTHEVIELSRKHLPVLQNYDIDLFLELRGISEASNISIENLVLVNHFTDMRDIRPGVNHDNVIADDGGCSIIYSKSGQNKILGQTWDIHASAMNYVLLLKYKDMILFSITGCLGMTGLSNRGVAIAINNLNSLDARVGILWPALVRRCLNQDDAIQAKDQILAAPLGSGHNYAVADKKSFFGIETSGTKMKVVSENPKKHYFHTNHCIDEEMRKTHTIRKESNTLWRLEHLNNNTINQPLDTAEEVFCALEGVSTPPRKDLPHKTATCGAFVMDIEGSKIIASAGVPVKELLSCPSATIHLNN
jgi:isopenicillin-N N-acyltransferase-like protein